MITVFFQDWHDAGSTNLQSIKKNWTSVYSSEVDLDSNMERLESSLSDPALCLQDLVTGVTTSSANSDIHGHHHLHDAAVSVSSAISGIMSGSSSSVLGHHVTSHEPPHHHGVVPHTPSLHHEPLEKLKRGEFVYYYKIWLLYRTLLLIRLK